MFNIVYSSCLVTVASEQHSLTTCVWSVYIWISKCTRNSFLLNLSFTCPSTSVFSETEQAHQNKQTIYDFRWPRNTQWNIRGTKQQHRPSPDSQGCKRMTNMPKYTVLSSVPHLHNLNQPCLLAVTCNSQHYCTSNATAITLQRPCSALNCHSTSKKRRFTPYFSTKASGPLQDRQSITWDTGGLQQPAALLFTSLSNHSLPASQVTTCVNSSPVIPASDRDDMSWWLSTSDVDLCFDFINMMQGTTKYNFLYARSHGIS